MIILEMKEDYEKDNEKLILPLKPCESINELFLYLPKNETIRDNAIKAWTKINDPKYEHIACSISGGADSDVLLDIIYRCDPDKKVKYVFFDTGIEYQATKDHLDYLEEKYGIKIDRVKPKKSVPLACKQYGQPFLSKMVSIYIKRLQQHNFKWEDEPYDVLTQRYQNCRSALAWWCCEKGEKSSFNITRNKWLKEFIIENPPDFKISDVCCNHAKKNNNHNYLKEHECDLTISGVRKSEGGQRAFVFNNCFTEKEDAPDEYRPLFFFKNADKEQYEEAANIVHSDCYIVYGLKRTGCAGCPFGRQFEYELEIINKYEQKLYKAINNIFKDSYEYTRQYLDFCKEMDSKYKSYQNYLREKSIKN